MKFWNTSQTTGSLETPNVISDLVRWGLRQPVHEAGRDKCRCVSALRGVATISRSVCGSADVTEKDVVLLRVCSNSRCARRRNARAGDVVVVFAACECRLKSVVSHQVALGRGDDGAD